MTIPTLAVERPAAPHAGLADTDARVIQRPGSTYDPAAVLSVVAFVIYVAFALGGAGGRSLALTYPLGCLVVGFVAYVRSPSTYFAFVWWLFLLTPFVRRVHDLRYGYQSTSTLLLGPLLAAGLAVFTVIMRRRMLRSGSYVPFLVAGAALTYAYLIGVIRQSATAATYDLLTWTVPLLFGLHVALDWRRFPALRGTLASCVLWGLVVTSVYGIWQFVEPQLWDRAWVVGAEMQSVGAPLPFMIRVFSTLNSPGPFSIMLVFSLLLGLAATQRWRALALALGLVALILSRGRSAWGALVLGGLVLQLRQPLRSLPRQWVALLAVLLIAAPVITQPRVMSVLTRRAATLRNVEQDHSFQNRVSFTKYAFSAMSTNPAGSGLGSLGGAGKLVSGGKAGFALDSGPLEVYGVMGWIGGTLFMLALAAIILPIVRARKARYDPTTSAAVAAVVALLATSLFGNIFNAVSGYFFWTAVGIATAGRTFASETAVQARLAALRARAA